MTDQSPIPPSPGQPYTPPQYADPQYAQPGTQPYGQPQYPQPYAQPQYPAQQYPQQYYGTYAAPAPRTNSMAVVALIAGIAGLSVVPFIGSIVAVITGPIARRQVRETGEQGDGMALAGLITGWIGVAGWALLLVFSVLLPLLIVAGASASG